MEAIAEQSTDGGNTQEQRLVYRMNNEITINVSDYLTEEEIKNIAIDTLRYNFNQQFRVEADVERVLANLSHEYVFKLVCDYISLNAEDIKQRIIEGVAEALTSDHVRYMVFRRKDAWDRSESPAVAILDDVLKSCRPKIEEEVNRRIQEYPFRELSEEIGDTIYYCIMNTLFPKGDS